ncbi:hypothetical protein EYF80_042868 [Liparis tanakae]|uniref:Uncharacterized protein n=1 Tax=Liparis tanakae TaxID=230148 RepID=A0A4Z2G184_9TELE|nr:hypothetical protein EYF80_042868 [Liparis tanakae]
MRHLTGRILRGYLPPELKVTSQIKPNAAALGGVPARRLSLGVRIASSAPTDSLLPLGNGWKPRSTCGTASVCRKIDVVSILRHPLAAHCSHRASASATTYE